MAPSDRPMVSSAEPVITMSSTVSRNTGTTMPIQPVARKARVSRRPKPGL